MSNEIEAKQEGAIANVPISPLILYLTNIGLSCTVQQLGKSKLNLNYLQKIHPKLNEFYPKVICGSFFIVTGYLLLYSLMLILFLQKVCCCLKFVFLCVCLCVLNFMCVDV